MTSPITSLLAAHPLPPTGGDKADRGTAVVVAGTPGCPGAALLAATAALRVGAGRVQIVTHPDLVTALGVAMPEALVIGWDTADAPPGSVAKLLGDASAVLVGPGLDDTAPAATLAVARHTAADTPLVLDARAVTAATELQGHVLLLLPNLEEAQELISTARGSGASDDPAALAGDLASSLAATVAVRGEDTVVTSGDERWSSAGERGLGTAGSGDVLAGLTAGLAARGMEPIAAIGWAVAAHATAGRLLADGRENPGYLARELLDAVPAAIERLAK